MSFNPQLLLASFGQLGANANNSALASAILNATSSNSQRGGNVQPIQQPSQLAAAPGTLAAAAPPASVPPSNTSLISTSQLQALVGGIVPHQQSQQLQQQLSSTAVASNSTDLPNDSLKQALASLFAGQNGQEPQQQQQQQQTDSLLSPHVAVGSCSASTVALLPGADGSSLQQLLGKVVQPNSDDNAIANLKQAPQEIHRNSASIPPPVATPQQQQQPNAAAPAGNLLDQLQKLNQSQQQPQLPPANTVPTLPGGLSNTATNPIAGDVQSQLAHLLLAAERQRKQKAQEESIRQAASQSGLARLIAQHQQLQQQSGNNEQNNLAASLLGALQNNAHVPQAQPSPIPAPPLSVNGSTASLLSNLFLQQQQQQQQQVPLASAPTVTNTQAVLAPRMPATAASTTTSTQALAPHHVPASSNGSASAVVAPPAATSSSSAEVPSFVAVPEKKRRRGRSGSFPQKIHQMLRDLEQQGRQDIASFVRDGTAFCIHRPKEFSKEVMPKYFKMGSYASFQRQLNLYNFTRIGEGPDRGSYWHELFLQGKPLLSTTMKRKESKKPNQDFPHQIEND